MDAVAWLEAEREAARQRAWECERKAAAALARGHREGWEHWANEADLAWQHNSRMVELLDMVRPLCSHCWDAEHSTPAEVVSNGMPLCRACWDATYAE